MKHVSWKKAVSLLLTLMLILSLFSGLSLPASAIADLEVPQEVRWIGNYSITWRPVDGASCYNVTLVYFAGTSQEKRVTHIHRTETTFQFPPATFETDDTTYRAIVVPLDSDYNEGPMGYTEIVTGNQIFHSYKSPETAYLSSSYTFGVNEANSSAECVIDRSKYIQPGDNGFVSAYDYAWADPATLPPGTDLAYGEAQTPSIYGKPTKVGIYPVKIYIRLVNGQNIYYTLTIAVLDNPIEISEKFNLTRGKPITLFLNSAQNDPGYYKVMQFSGSLPPGMALSESEAEKQIIKGTPTKTGAYTAGFWLITTEGKYYQSTVSFIVDDENASIASVKRTILTGKPFALILPNELQAPYTGAEVMEGSLPPGLEWTLIKDQGVQIAGRPNTPGSYSIVFRITDDHNGLQRVQLNIKVNDSSEILDEYEIDLVNGQTFSEGTENQYLAKSLLYAILSGQLKTKTEDDNILYDFDENGAYDVVSCTQNDTMLWSELGSNSLEGNFTFTLSDATINMMGAGATGYVRNIIIKLEEPVSFCSFQLWTGEFDIPQKEWERTALPSLLAAVEADQIYGGYDSGAYIFDLDYNGTADVAFCPEVGHCPVYVLGTSSLRSDFLLELSQEAIDIMDPYFGAYAERVFFRLTPDMINMFEDVKSDAYYYDPVLWAFNHIPKVTTGVDDTHFKPDDTCTRCQVVTFLWRSFGCPAPETDRNPFVDVAADKYYYQAVLWAVEKGITNGIDDTHFGPDRGCTRGQVVTFLWRAKQGPRPRSDANPFDDVTSDKYYYDAVLWAVENGVTNGTSATKFSPDATCTRGQIVTFLYRAAQLREERLNFRHRKDLLAYVNEAFFVPGRGTFVTTWVENGWVQPGDKLVLWSYDPDSFEPVAYDTQVVHIYESGTNTELEEANYTTGWVDIQLKGVSAGDIKPDDALIKAGTGLVPVRDRVYGTVTMYGGEKDFYYYLYEGSDYTFRLYQRTVNFRPVSMPYNVILSGQTCENVEIGEFDIPTVVCVGQRLYIYSMIGGDSPVGEIEITKIVG